jgi:antitoxin component of RelBE/YafQ-DinJ toxin-antitoxin module
VITLDTRKNHSGNTMSEDSSYRIRVDQELKDAFLKVADACDRTGAQLVRDFMRRYARENRDALQRDLLEEISDQEGEDIV